MVEQPVLAALTVALLVEGLVIAGIVLSIVSPRHRIWPPGEVSWRFWYYWGGSTITFAALVVVGYETAGQFVFDGLAWDLVGWFLVGVGGLFAAWAGYTFRTAESFGIEGRLHTEGPYALSRNPQYVGMAVVIVGVLLLVNSAWLVVGMLPVFPWLSLLPFAEEPWLRERFGEEYEAYCRRVPRFVGLTTVTRLFE
ncbi:MAG: isoprenylcysteine carboxylmethyltransferase family protein [Halorientalis sp.]